MTKTPKLNKAAQALGRLGGQAGTAKQNAARRANAQKGGRPRRVCVYCGEPVVGGHENRSLDRTCGAHGWTWQKAGADPVPRRRADPTLLDDLLRAFDGEEDSVQREHAKLIARLRAAVG